MSNNVNDNVKMKWKVKGIVERGFFFWVEQKKNFNLRYQMQV